MPQISITIPVYNVEKYIRECLDSVLAQTFPNYECILVDDGSPDNCPAICDEYAGMDFRFKVIHKKNGGLSDARNEGIKAAKGEYIVLLDSDDLFADKKALENIWKIIQTTKADVIYNSNFTIFNDNDFTSSDGFDKDFIFGDTIHFYKKLFRSRNTLCGCCFTVQRDFLLRHNLYFKTGIFHEDEHWMPRVICAAFRIIVNHNLFYAYRTGRPGSVMYNLTPKRLFDIISIIEDLLNLSKAKDIKTFHRFVYMDRCSRLWKRVFHSIILLDTAHYQDTVLLLEKLKKKSPLLLYKISVKNGVFYFLINFINLSPTRYKYIIKLIKYMKNYK